MIARTEVAERVRERLARDLTDSSDDEEEEEEEEIVDEEMEDEDGPEGNDVDDWDVPANGWC